LPPSREEIAFFENDSRPDAYERLVDRALSSPRYGERWARHWLDLIRFGETDGFETNRERPNAWRFRDYVIDAFNSDKPYDVFIREQLAGDSYGEPVGTGFLVAGPVDIVKSPDPSLTLKQRQDELADMINTTGTTFLGLTTGCARCHDHKFDPISQRDYYSMQAVFAGVVFGETPLPAIKDTTSEVTALSRRVSDLNAALTKFLDVAAPNLVYIDDVAVEPESNRRGLVTRISPQGRPPYPKGTGRGERNYQGGRDLSRNVSRGTYSWWSEPGEEFVSYYRTLVEGKRRVWLSWGSGWSTHSKKVEYVLDRDGDLDSTKDQEVIATVDQQRFADGTGEPQDRQLWSGFADAGVHEFTATSIIALRSRGLAAAVTADIIALGAPDDAAKRIPLLRSPVSSTHNVERIQPTSARFVRFYALATNSSEPCLDEMEIYSKGKNVGLASGGAKATASSNLPGYAIHQIHHINDGLYGNRHSWIAKESKGWTQIELPRTTVIDRIDWSRDRTGNFRDRVPMEYRIEASLNAKEWVTISSSEDRMRPGDAAQSALTHRFDRFPKKEAERGKRLFAGLQSARKELQRVRTPRRSYSGTFRQPGPTHVLYRGDPMAKRDIVSPDAISALGKLGLSQSSPEAERRRELSEWIASKSNPLTARVLVNRLWQFTFGIGLVDTPSDFGANGTPPSHPRLLDWLATELMRTSWSVKHVQRLLLNSSTFRQSSAPSAKALSIDAAGRLLWRFPPRRLEAEAIRDSILNASGVLSLRMHGPGFSGFRVQNENVRHYFPKERYGPGDFRRMVYMTKVRQEHESVFGAFDCPDASQVAPVRSRSTTPLQALNLFNSKFVAEQAELFAKRLEHERDGDERIRLAFELSFGRDPDAEELREAVRFVANHGLTALCRAFLNTNEFLFIP
ncbi:MAG: DUF1553 domain-containing protein, partial [Planctomycetota bacterium]